MTLMSATVCWHGFRPSARFMSRNCGRGMRYAELQKSHQQTSADLLKLREDYQDVLHQLQLLRRWAFGARRERFVDDPRQKHLFDLDSILPPSIAMPSLHSCIRESAASVSSGQMTRP
jgi:hypothetical protein